MKKLSKGSEVVAKSKDKSRKSPKGSESPHNLGMTRSIKKPEKKTNSKKITQMMNCPQVLCANSDESRSENFLQGQASIASVPNVIMTMTPASNLLSLSNRVPVHPFMLAEATPVAQTWASGNQGVNPMSVSSSSM
jgi:hypothetical protein